MATSEDNVYGQIAEFDFNPFGFDIFKAGVALSAQTRAGGWFKLQPLGAQVNLASSTELNANTAFSAVSFTNTVMGKFTAITLSGNSGDMIAYRLGT